MGILDSIKNRLPKAGRQDGYDDYYGDEYTEYYRENDFAEANAQGKGYGLDGNGASGAQPAGTRRRLSTSRGYRNDDHAPLISMTDVRSQELSFEEERAQAAGSSAVRSATVRPRAARTTARALENTGQLSAQESSEDSSYVSAYPEDAVRQSAGVISRTESNSLSDLHSTRMQTQDSSGYAYAQDMPEFYTGRSGSAIPRQSRAQRPTSTPKYSNSLQKAVRPQAKRGFRELEVLRPTSYADAEQVAKALKNGSAVALDLTQTRPELAKRILDFSFGAACALSAQVESPANRVYVITCDYELSPEEHELLVARGVIR
jgi:cell division inhibitor SepF